MTKRSNAEPKHGRIVYFQDPATRVHREGVIVSILKADDYGNPMHIDVAVWDHSNFDDATHSSNAKVYRLTVDQIQYCFVR